MKLTNLELSRQIPATPEEVYDVWIDPRHPGGPWFGPQTEHQQSKVILDAKVDGLFYHRVTAGGQSWIHYGRFIQLERGKLAEHTWVCEATKGRESIVTTTPGDASPFNALRFGLLFTGSNSAGRNPVIACNRAWLLYCEPEAVLAAKKIDCQSGLQRLSKRTKFFVGCSFARFTSLPT